MLEQLHSVLELNFLAELHTPDEELSLLEQLHSVLELNFLAELLHLVLKLTLTGLNNSDVALYFLTGLNNSGEERNSLKEPSSFC